MRKIALFLILALILTGGIAFAVKKLINNQVSPSEIISQSKLPTAKFTCPLNGWVDCMPIMDEAKILACSGEAEDWYKSNCPNFQGFAQ